MAKHSPARAAWPLLPGLEVFSRGKIRDSYLLPCGKILQVATDAISIFDFILNALVPMKGIILVAMSVFWFKLLESYGIKTHLVAYGADIDKYLPEHLRNNPDLQSRALVVEKLDMVDDVEFIPRAVLTGSALEPYNKTGMIFGRKLPAGLQDGDELPYPMDTATTKAKEGHDEHLTADDVRRKYPEQVYLSMKIFSIAQTYARKCGLFYADTKFEFGKDGTLGDEVLDPDSSRIWDYMQWLISRKPATGRKAPPSNDKQLVREWGKTMGINDETKFDPKKPEDVDKVHAMVVPGEIIAQTTQTYRYIFWRLTGMTIEQFLREVMKVNIPDRGKRKVLVVCGSETDLPAVKSACDFCVAPSQMAVTVHIMSCHRNPQAVRDFAENGDLNFDAIVCVGSMAFALAGVLDAWLYFFKRNIRVAGVALGQVGSEDLLAAELSIRRLPGQPVVIDEVSGKAYVGEAGLVSVFHRLQKGELTPQKPRKEKPVQMKVWSNCS